MENNNCRFEKIKVDLLHSQLKYQREIKYDRVKEIASSWDWGKFDMPCVNFRDGMYSVIEGQNTVAAAKMKFGTNVEIMCKVKVDLTEEEESKWFDEEAEKKRGQELDTRYRAKLLSKNPKLMKLIADLKLAGLILKINIPNGKCVIDAIKAIENIHEEMNDIDFISCFRLLRDTWNGDVESLRAPFLRGMSKFYETFFSEFSEKKICNSIV